MDIDTMAFKDEFDVVVSNAAFHWVKDHQRLLKKVFRALRDMGQVRFNFATDGNSSHFFKVVRKAMKKDAFFPYFREFSWPWYMPN